MIYDEETLLDYKENRPKLVKQTKARLEKIKADLTPIEKDYFMCLICRAKVLVRTAGAHLCMECYISAIVKGTCSKCGDPILKENKTGMCSLREYC